MEALDDDDLQRRYGVQLGSGSVVLVNLQGDDVAEVYHRVPFDGRLDLLFSPDDGDEYGQVLEMVMRV